MNGGALTPSDLDAASRAVPASPRELDDDDVRKAWAAALCAAVPPTPIAVTSVAAGSPPVGWRPSDVSMTELGDELARTDPRPSGVAGAEATASVVSRLETAVDAGNLGRVGFVVDRSSRGLSIVVEVTGEAAARAVDGEKQVLLRTLRAAGLTVLSFRILVRGGSGTPLAQGEPGHHAKGVSRSRMRYSRAALHEECDDPENVDIVG